MSPNKMIIEHSFLGRTGYGDALSMQKSLSGKIAQSLGGSCAGYLIQLEHNPVITNGRFGADDNFKLPLSQLKENGVEVFETDRGGDVTYHGPGQLVSYPIVNLRTLKIGAKSYVSTLEDTIIRVLGSYGIDARRKEGYPGVWTEDGKIASIGVSIKRGVTMHGTALNVNTDLSYFSLIVPCGIPGVKITSMKNITRQTFRLNDVAERYMECLFDILGVNPVPLTDFQHEPLNPEHTG